MVKLHPDKLSPSLEVSLVFFTVFSRGGRFFGQNGEVALQVFSGSLSRSSRALLLAQGCLEQWMDVKMERQPKRSDLGGFEGQIPQCPFSPASFLVRVP